MQVRTFEADRLRKRGYSFKTDAETKLFSEVITETFEKRLKNACVYLSDDNDIPFFTDGISDDEYLDWLEDHLSDFREIYKRCECEFWQELRKYRDDIPGLIYATPPEILAMPIEEMDISVRSFSCMKRAGINTVSDILEHGDLSDVRNLGKKGIDEVRNKLCELGL